MLHQLSSNAGPAPAEVSGLRRRRLGSSDADANGSTATPIPNRNSNSSLPPTPPAALAAPPTLPPQKQQSVVPLSMQLMRPFWQLSCCPDPSCATNTNRGSFMNGSSFNDDFFAGNSNTNNNSNNNSEYAIPTRSRNASMDGKVDVRPPDNGSRGEEYMHGTIQDEHNDSNLSVRPVSTESSFGSSSNNNHQSTPKQKVDHVNNQQIVMSPYATTPTRYTTPSLSSSNNRVVSIEQLLHEYTAACSIFGCSTRINPGILTTLRFSLPTLRVSGSFFDADMLALSELLLNHCNGALHYIRRLDFTIAGKEGKDRSSHYGGSSGSGKKGVRSHGAYALSKVLSQSLYIEEVYLSGNRVGSYGSSAIFTAAAQNRREGGRLRTLLMRGCRIGERGSLKFAEEICCATSAITNEVGGGLQEVDLSANRIGFRGCFAIEEALKEQTKVLNYEGGEGKSRIPSMQVDLEGNMVFQEVMNCVTHGLGILLGTLGTYLLSKQVSGRPSHYIISCAIYSASLIVLYTSSTLYHSFFALKKTKHIFKVFDRCAIYLLIAGSYTPFLMIALHHEPMWSLHLLLFIWACAISGVLVEALASQWKHKSKFSLTMYLGMGWSCMACLPDLLEVLPTSAVALMVAGGVAYTGGVPFFVRNNNLDHSIWHLFVLAGSIFHWLAVYHYIAV